MPQKNLPCHSFPLKNKNGSDVSFAFGHITAAIDFKWMAKPLGLKNLYPPRLFQLKVTRI